MAQGAGGVTVPKEPCGCALSGHGRGGLIAGPDGLSDLSNLNNSVIL